MDQNQAEINAKMNQIMQALISQLYVATTTKDGETFSATLQFDEVQRITGIENLLVEGQVKMPTFELITKLNEVSQQINSLPEIYKLKSLEVAVSSDNQVSIKPTYLKN